MKSMKPFAHLLAALMLLAGLAGCGGSGGSNDDGGGGPPPPPPPPPVERATFQLGLNWAARSRDARGPSSALSVVAILRTPGTVFDDVQVVHNRRSDPAAYNETITSREQATVGDHTLIVRFYAGTSGTGAIVAQASVNVKLTNAGVLTKPDGTPLGNIALVGTIKSVQVQPSSIMEDSTQQLGFLAFNEANQPVAVSPGSALFSLISGGDKMSLTDDGVAAALNAGTAVVRAVVDGVISPNVNITITRKLLNWTTSVGWPARSREVEGPNSALSARLILKNAGPGGADSVINLDRGTNLSAHMQEVTSTGVVTYGTQTLEFRFFANAGQTGQVVAQGTAPVRVSRTNGALLNDDGTPLNVLIGERTIRSVRVSPNNVVETGTELQLTFVARDQDGNIVTVTPGSGLWEIVNGAQFGRITADGKVTGVASGIVNVRVRLDGVVSEPSPVRVVAARTDFKLSIVWPTRTRASAEGLQSALSAVIGLRDLTPGSDVEHSVTINRRSEPAGYTEEYTVLQQAPAGRWIATVNYYSLPDAGGEFVGRASVSAELLPNGEIVAPGTTTPIGNIPVVPNIVAVDFIPDQVIRIGKTVQLLAFVTDENGFEFLLTPGSFTWTYVQPDEDPPPPITATITPDGIAQGLLRGDAPIRVSVDGVSADEDIPVILGGP